MCALDACAIKNRIVPGPPSAGVHHKDVPNDSAR